MKKLKSIFNTFIVNPLTKFFNLVAQHKTTKNILNSDNVSMLQSRRVLSIGLLLGILICAFMVLFARPQDVSSTPKTRTKLQKGQVASRPLRDPVSDDSHAYFLQQDVNEDLKNKIVQLSEALKVVKIQLAKTESKIVQSNRAQTIAKIQIPDAHNSTYSQKKTTQKKPIENSQIGHVSFEPKISGHTSKNFIPEGAFASGVLLSGVDCSITNNGVTGNDIVLMQVMEKGFLPNGVRSKVEGCRILIEVLAHPSSGRVRGRAISLTCVNKNTKQVIQTSIKGVVVGSDGKQGLPARYIVPNGASLVGATLAKGLSAFSNTLSQDMPRFALFQNPEAKASLGSAIKSNVIKGASGMVNGGGDMLSDYFLQRANMMPPYLDVSAGQALDVIFIGGAEFGVMKENKKKKETTT